MPVADSLLGPTMSCALAGIPPAACAPLHIWRPCATYLMLAIFARLSSSAISSLALSFDASRTTTSAFRGLTTTRLALAVTRGISGCEENAERGLRWWG